MPTWVFVCLWIIWLMWLLVEVIGGLNVAAHNSDRRKVALYGPVRYSETSKFVTCSFLVLTVFWFGYNISLWF